MNKEAVKKDRVILEFDELMNNYKAMICEYK